MRRAAPLSERKARGPRPRKPRHRFKKFLREAEAIAVLANSESKVSFPDAFALIGTQAGCLIRSDLFGTGNAGLIHSRMERGAVASLRCMLSLLSRDTTISKHFELMENNLLDAETNVLPQNLIY